MLNNLLQLQEAMRRCSACGRCLAVCPSSKICGLEAYGPRGRVVLGLALLERRIQPNEIISSYAACLQCGKCEAACPARLPLSAFFLSIRAYLRKYFAVPSWIKITEHMLLTKPGATGFLQPPAIYGVALSGKLRKTRRNFPQLPAAPFSLRGNQEQKTGRETILLFTGCITRHVFPDLAKDCVAALELAGKTVISPTGLGCCGRPQLMRGASPLQGVKRNLALLADARFDNLVTPCPGCLKTIRDIWPNLAGLDEKEKEQAKEVARRSQDICAFLAASGIPIPEGVKRPLFWHKPCLLADENNALRLANAEGALTGKSGENACCGGPLATTGAWGKTDVFSGSHALSAQMGANLRHQALQAGAAQILTACPGCMLALTRENMAARETLPVRHVISVYMESAEKQKKS